MIILNLLMGTQLRILSNAKGVDVHPVGLFNFVNALDIFLKGDGLLVIVEFVQFHEVNSRHFLFLCHTISLSLC